jgi:RhtB (resistance to homoserine/threonine) family protein
MIMLGINAFPLFVGAVTLLNLTPGPDMAYVVGHSIAHGRRAGVLSALGVSLGGCVHTMACAFGLSALLAESTSAFNVIKWVGAIYLIYIGISTLLIRSDVHVVDRAVSLPCVPLGALLVRGFVTNVTNPKVLLFYIAFLPQFVETNSPHKTVAFFVLGTVMVLLGFLNDSVVACCAAMVASALRKRSTVTRWLNRVVGATFVGMGIRLAAATR